MSSALFVVLKDSDKDKGSMRMYHYSDLIFASSLSPPSKLLSDERYDAEDRASLPIYSLLKEVITEPNEDLLEKVSQRSI